MIRLENLCKEFRTKEDRKCIADDITAQFPSRRSIGLLGRNGAGKTTLLRMIAGTLLPDAGKIYRWGSISWPVGYRGSFHPELSGAQNVRFIARIYGVDTDQLIDYVARFAELGPQFHMPVRTYSTGMRARLAFGASMGIKFDMYLVDEVTSVGDAAFREKSCELFKKRMKTSGAIVVSHGMGMIRRLCDMAVIFDQGRLIFYDDVEEAIRIHKRTMGLMAA